ncbi:hypothetical protein QCA50_018939 [Cerrena zonata]|uniref:Uncharacterized protein n=1 Tax=Cerrena zonata TaxID=2478898 RepID=A0AAW0FEW7_9APHY
MYPPAFPDARATHVSLPTHPFFSGASGSQMHPQNGPISHPSELPTAGNVISQQGQPSAFPPPYAFPGYSFLPAPFPWLYPGMPPYAWPPPPPTHRESAAPNAVNTRPIEEHPATANKISAASDNGMIFHQIISLSIN